MILLCLHLSPVSVLLLGFEGLLRTAEMLSLTTSDMLFRDGVGILRLPDTKTSKSKSMEEVVIIRHPWILTIAQVVQVMYDRHTLHVYNHTDLMGNGYHFDALIRGPLWKQDADMGHVQNVVVALQKAAPETSAPNVQRPPRNAATTAAAFDANLAGKQTTFPDEVPCLLRMFWFAPM